MLYVYDPLIVVTYSVSELRFLYYRGIHYWRLEWLDPFREVAV